MSSLKARINKLHSGVISNVTSTIEIRKDDKVIKRRTYGTNEHKVVEIVVRL